MIQLHHDYLVFQTSNGELIPCSAEVVAVEMVGEYVSHVHPQLLQQAAAAVLHYFKHDQGRQQVTVHEFSLALERVLKAFGFTIEADGPAPVASAVRAFEVLDLPQLASDAGGAFELAFFPRIREQLHSRLGQRPETVACRGLRKCVKQLLGRKRWSRRCEAFSDQIVHYLRECLSSDPRVGSCRLVVR